MTNTQSTNDLSELREQLHSIIDEFTEPGKGERYISELEDDILSLIHHHDQRIIAEAEKAKDNAYWERDQLVAVLSKLYPSHLARHSDSDTEWEDDWRTIVCIHTPAGQATWHIHDSETKYFTHLFDKEVLNHWDGHTTEEKYKRLSRFSAQQEQKNE